MIRGAKRARMGGELPEPPGHQLDVMALGQQDALGGTEEPAAVGHARFGQNGVVPEQERAPEHQVLPVVAFSERRQEGVGVARTEPEADGVPPSDEGGGLLR